MTKKSYQWLYDFARSPITKYQRLGALYFLTVLGVSRLGFSCGLSPWLAEGHFLAVSSHGPSSVHVQPWCLSVCPNFLFL